MPRIWAGPSPAWTRPWGAFDCAIVAGLVAKPMIARAMELDVVENAEHDKDQADQMAKFGIGASVHRKEDERFLRGLGQYVGDHCLPNMREVAFVRSPVAHARLKQVRIPERSRNAVFTAQDLISVKPIVSAPPLNGFKRSVEPILADKKLRFVGEIVAMCMARTRAEAEDIAATITLEYDELPAVTDMLAACEPSSALVHDEWGDNIFVEFSENGSIEEARAAPIKVTRQIRTARHCMYPLEGRGVIAYRDARLRLLTLITSTQFPHTVQTGLRVSRHQARTAARYFAGCRRRLWLQGTAVSRRGCARLAGATGRPSGLLAGRQPRAPDCECELPRASLSDHRLRDRRRQACRRRLRRPCRCRGLLLISDFVVSGGGANPKPLTRSLCFIGLSMPICRCCHQQMPHPALPRGRPHRHLSGD